MALTKQEFSKYIQEFNFRELFNDMGWNNDNTTQPIVLEDVTYLLKAVAEKSGFKILICNPDESGNIPEYNTRKKIEGKVTKLFQEHLIIFFDKEKQKQIWQLVVRQTGKPTKMTETRYHITQDPELLYQRASGLFFTLDEEEKITIVDVTQRVTENFQQNNEKVTKQFYDRFTKEHTTFLKFIKGIDDKVDKDWYASLMLNRLMFCYFIQKKGFLDNNKNYLNNKLNEYKKTKGKNKFFSFYRHFLLTLFHDGLGAPNHDDALKKEIGIIPYLNGGLFDEHELENLYKNIDIEDNAFEQIFSFFNEYEWHLDTRITATGKEINPDVIGYIFEKYINDRAEMGAYYTKEDITDYISKNCIIPFLFNETKRQYPEAFSPDNEIWTTFKVSGDRYIYDAVKHGINTDDNFNDFPDEISIGLDPNQPDLFEIRKAWNTPAPNSVGLPTELWRDVIDRGKRYSDVKRKIENGEISNINDFITYNLNIRQFAQDIIESISDKKFIECFYKSLSEISVLDPTCGSGAFLFSAMNILEPLYEGCLQRMENFIKETSNKDNELFENVIEHVNSAEHSNRSYFIFKSIILQNLYGVDIMREAVETAKLRLFLKLVATVDVDYSKSNLGLEPLPDIDFNIRAGNTLVGFANEVELQKGLRYTLDGLMAQPEIQEKCDEVADAFNQYKEIQLDSKIGHQKFKDKKENLRKHLNELNEKLHHLLHQQASKINYDHWLESHLPFHWFAEFYEIIHGRKGFDVIIGNPPYIECSKIKYDLSKFSTLKSGNLYALVIENCTKLLKETGYLGMIVQNSIVCTKRMIPIQKYLYNLYNIYFSNYDDRPAKLFTGINHMKGTILITVPRKNSEIKTIHTTKFYRWYDEYRFHVFENLTYIKLDKALHFEGHISKLSDNLHISVLKKAYQQKMLGLSLSNTGKVVYCHRIASYFIKAIDFVPYFYNEKAGQKKSDDYKEYCIPTDENKLILMALLNSNIFYINWHTLHDGYHCGKKNIDEFPFEFPDLNSPRGTKLRELGTEISKDYLKNAFRRETVYKNTGQVIYDEFYPKLSKPIIDKIDIALAQHYGFTSEELDFIINYDIKYRMGKELENGKDEDL